MTEKLEINTEWTKFDKGQTIGKKGVEGGTILKDIENVYGARISLEKDCEIAPFAIMFGIYGVMFHTHFEAKMEFAEKYIELKKSQIEEVFEHYEIPEEFRDGLWNEKHNTLMDKLIDFESVENEKTLSQSTFKSFLLFVKSWCKKLFGYPSI